MIFVVSEDYYFVSHRLPMARVARDMGFRVLVACRLRHCRDAIEREGFEAVHVPIVRANRNPLREIAAVLALVRLFRRENPAIIVNVALKPIIDGSVAGLFCRRAIVVNLFAGLGTLFETPEAPGVLRGLVVAALRHATTGPRYRTIAQNPDDLARLVRLRLADDARATLIPGSGVDTTAFRASEEPPGRPVAKMVSRLLWSKGVGVLVEAARLLRRRNVALDIEIVGAGDPANPASVPDVFVEACNAEGVVRFVGKRADIAAEWRRAHIAVLPSFYPEGLPKALLEAAAAARPVVTTDTPGCRSLVRGNPMENGATGLLVPPRDAEALADALEALANDAPLRRRMGHAARQLVEREYDERIIAEHTAALFRSLLDGGVGRLDSPTVEQA